MPAPDGDAVKLTPIRIASAAELAAEEIRRAIAAGRYQPGDRLPNQRELISQLQVSRSTLQEATRTLAAEGLVAVRRGAHGGIRVLASPGGSSDDDQASTIKNARDVDEVLDLRVTLESGAAYLAAERRTDGDLQRIRAAFDAMQSVFDEARLEAVAEFWQADIAFHRSIAESTHNDRLRDLTEAARAQFLSPLGRVFTQLHPQAHDGHREILDFIEAGDQMAASTAAREHVELTRRVVHGLIRPGQARGHD